MRSFHRLLIRADAAMRKTVLGGAAAVGLSSGQPKLLEYLYICGDADQKTIAANSGIEAATAGTVLFGMEEKGLIWRKRSENDKRSIIVGLTDKGRAAAECAVKVFADADKKALDGMSEKETEKLCRMLEKICANLGC